MEEREEAEYICSECGGDVTLEDTVCPHCGEDIREVEEEYICTTCSSDVLEDEKICPICGDDLKKIEKVNENNPTYRLRRFFSFRPEKLENYRYIGTLLIPLGLWILLVDVLNILFQGKGAILNFMAGILYVFLGIAIRFRVVFCLYIGIFLFAFHIGYFSFSGILKSKGVFEKSMAIVLIGMFLAILWSFAKSTPIYLKWYKNRNIRMRGSL